jgi:hypothetical protein
VQDASKLTSGGATSSEGGTSLEKSGGEADTEGDNPEAEDVDTTSTKRLSSEQDATPDEVTVSVDTISSDQDEEVKSKPPRVPKSGSHIRESSYVLSAPVTDKTCTVLSEGLKIIFNQTVNWKQDNQLSDVRIM